MTSKFFYPSTIPASSCGNSGAVIQCLEHALNLAESAMSSFLQLRLAVHVIGTSVQHAGLTCVLLSLFPLFTDSLFNTDLEGKGGCILEADFLASRLICTWDQRT